MGALTQCHLASSGIKEARLFNASHYGGTRRLALYFRDTLSRALLLTADSSFHKTQGIAALNLASMNYLCVNARTRKVPKITEIAYILFCDSPKNTGVSG